MGPRLLRTGRPPVVHAYCPASRHVVRPSIASAFDAFPAEPAQQDDDADVEKSMR